jgi:hypothetical protein
MLSEVYGGEAMKEWSFSEWHKLFKNGLENVENYKRAVVEDLTESMKMFKKCGIWRIQVDVYISELWLCN